jgi:hypothetical protein
VTDTNTTTVETEPMFCDAAGVYCGARTVEQLQAAGRAHVCCRHYLDDEDD